jgi:hypothetical protein
MEQVLSEEVGTTGRGKGVGNGFKSVNMVQILCTRVYVNGKKMPVKIIPGVGAEGIKENGGGGEFKYDIL